MADLPEISLLIERFLQAIKDVKDEIKKEIDKNETKINNEIISIKKDVLDLQLKESKSGVKVDLFWKIIAAVAVGIAMLKGGFK